MSAVNHSECGGSAASAAETTDDYHVKFDFCPASVRSGGAEDGGEKRHSGGALRPVSDCFMTNCFIHLIITTFAEPNTRVDGTCVIAYRRPYPPERLDADLHCARGNVTGIRAGK